MTENALKGIYNGGTIPFGYMIDETRHYQPDPLLAPYEDFRVFLTCSDAEQTRRLQAREGDCYPDFAARWVPLEEAYFTQHNIEDAADFVMDTTTD